MGANTNCRRILVVDDNELSALTLTWAMELFGYEVRTCYSGASAISVAHDFDPQVVLLDIGMPLMNGYEVCRKLKEDPQTAAALIVAQTGWGDAATKQRAAQAGFDHHFTKPLDIDAVHHLIEYAAA